MELARRLGYGRVIGGVHFAMDVLAGEKLGQADADVIVEQPAFTQAIERIRGRQPPSRGHLGLMAPVASWLRSDGGHAAGLAPGPGLRQV